MSRRLWARCRLSSPVGEVAEILLDVSISNYTALCVDESNEALGDGDTASTLEWEVPANASANASLGFQLDAVAATRRRRLVGYTPPPWLRPSSYAFTLDLLAGGRALLGEVAQYKLSGYDANAAAVFPRGGRRLHCRLRRPRRPAVAAAIAADSATPPPPATPANTSELHQPAGEAATPVARPGDRRRRGRRVPPVRRRRRRRPLSRRRDHDRKSFQAIGGGAPGDNLNVGVVHGMTRRPSALKMGQGKSMLKLGGPSQESVTAGLAEARKAEQARVRPSKKVGGDPATVEETGKLMTQKI